MNMFILSFYYKDRLIDWYIYNFLSFQFTQVFHGDVVVLKKTGNQLLFALMSMHTVKLEWMYSHFRATALHKSGLMECFPPPRICALIQRRGTRRWRRDGSVNKPRAEPSYFLQHPAAFSISPLGPDNGNYCWHHWVTVKSESIDGDVPQWLATLMKVCSQASLHIAAVLVTLLTVAAGRKLISTCRCNPTSPQNKTKKTIWKSLEPSII